MFRLALLALIWLIAFGGYAQPERPALFQPAPRPMPGKLVFAEDLRLELYFVTLQPGGSGLLRLSGADVTGARYTFRDAEAAFFAHADGGWHALLAIDMDAPPGLYALNVVAERESDSLEFTLELSIEQAGFIVQEFALPADRAHLVNAAVEAAELARLAELVGPRSPKPLWDASGFALPLDSPMTSPYGSFRLLNDAWQTRHSGWDQVAPIGSPIRAMAAGRVVFADRLEIRGNFALIDHGLGVYSGYAHLSELLAREGQSVAAGQVIGSSGNTGRSSGPHLHWEIVANGIWLDGLAFLELWLPA